MKTSKNEELQSRREFFKSAAKAALPVIGAVLMSQIPLGVNAKEPGGNCGMCQYSCTACVGGCMDNCARSCQQCSHGCARSCNYNSK